MSKEISMRELLEILVEDSNKLQRQFVKLEEKIDSLEEKMDKRFDYNETWLNRIENNMATKTQFNRLAGNFNKLVDILDKDRVISSYDATRVTYSD